ncbi:DUF3570 domain-containing protein [Flavisolibacter nicotianae]|uniref:DUF3570 domain-containing protein n=1 Tax=Flavisolibacter nicotianae TaxID=2364882 RepID=UPI000EAC2184|nr:DUF3570 domain-containing protein [Flavisolibacter nicotianae]
MKKICLSVVGLFLSFVALFGQTEKDTSTYKPRKLTFEEANLVSSYYRQDGNNSAVTGGIGTENLTDYSNTVDLKFVKWGRKDIKHSFHLEVGMDHYTSASSDKINPYTISSPSHADTRIYPSLSWMAENNAKGTTVGAGLSFSNEFDYRSIGANVLFAQKTANRNGEFSARLQAYLDNLKLIYPIELRSGVIPTTREEERGDDYATASRNSFSGSFSYSQIINPSLQLALIADVVYQQGYLGLPFHRIYFTDGNVAIENLPDTRLKIPLGFRANYFVGDKLILRSFYRFYHDDWGLTAHTAQFETSMKLSPFFSLTPFYRYYKQNSVNYFAPYKVHSPSETYYTSNYDLSAFNSHFYGAGFRLTPATGVFHVQRISALELRYGHYNRTTGLNSDIVSLNLQFK